MKKSEGLFCDRCNEVIAQDVRVAKARPLVTYEHFNKPEIGVHIPCNQEHPIRLG